MCVQGCFCLQRKPRQTNPQPSPYPLTGGLGLIKLLSKTRRDEFPSFHLPCHPFNSAEIRSFLFTCVKIARIGAWIKGEGGLKWGRRKHVACTAKVQNPRNKQRSREGVNVRGTVRSESSIWVSHAAPPLVLFTPIFIF